MQTVFKKSLNNLSVSNQIKFRLIIHLNGSTWSLFKLRLRLRLGSFASKALTVSFMLEALKSLHILGSGFLKTEKNEN